MCALQRESAARFPSLTGANIKKCELEPGATLICSHCFLSFDRVAHSGDDSQWVIFGIFTDTIESAGYPTRHWTNSCTLNETAGWQQSAAGSMGDNTHIVCPSFISSPAWIEESASSGCRQTGSPQNRPHCSSLILREQQQQADETLVGLIEHCVNCWRHVWFKCSKIVRNFDSSDQIVKKEKKHTCSF